MVLEKEKEKKKENEKKNINKEEIKQIQKKTNKIVLITFAVVMIIIVSIAGITSIVSNINEKKKQEQIALEESQKVTIPNVVGKTYKEAKEELEKLELKVDAKLGNSEDDDIVTTQSPYARERIKKGETITIYLRKPATTKSDTSFTGATFRKKWSELKEDIDTYYNEHYKDNITVMKENKIVLEHTNDAEYAIFKYYKFRNPTLQESVIGMPVGSDNVAYISATVDTTNDNIICITYTWSTKVNLDDYLIDLPFILDFVSEQANLRTKTSEFFNQIDNALKEEKSLDDINVNSYYKDNIFIFTNGNQNQTNIMICAADEQEVKYYRENGNWRKSTDVQTSSNTDTSTTSENYYEHPQEWYEEQERLYADNTPSTTKPSSSSSQSSSNKGTSTSSSNSNTNTQSSVKPYITISVDPLSYLSEEDKNRVVKSNGNESVSIVIKFNNKVIKSDNFKFTNDSMVTYEKLEVDKDKGTLTVEINGKQVPDVNGETSVDVSMYSMSDEWYSNTFTFYDVSKYAG